MFLCPKHKQALCQQPVPELEALCDEWLNLAIVHYQQQRWSFALPYAGCAMEVCWIQMEEQMDSQLIVKSLCLAIYCSNILQHMYELEQGQHVLEMNLRQLQNHNQENDEHQSLLETCLTLSLSPSGHKQLISQYTNWPYESSASSPSRVLH